MLGSLTAGEPSATQHSGVSAFALNIGSSEPSAIVEVNADADLKSASHESGISNPTDSVDAKKEYVLVAMDRSSSGGEVTPVTQE